MNSFSQLNTCDRCLAFCARDTPCPSVCHPMPMLLSQLLCGDEGGWLQGSPSDFTLVIQKEWGEGIWLMSAYHLSLAGKD